METSCASHLSSSCRDDGRDRRINGMNNIEICRQLVGFCSWFVSRLEASTTRSTLVYIRLNVFSGVLLSGRPDGRLFQVNGGSIESETPWTNSSDALLGRFLSTDDLKHSSHSTGAALRGQGGPRPHSNVCFHVPPQQSPMSNGWYWIWLRKGEHKEQSYGLYGFGYTIFIAYIGFGRTVTNFTTVYFMLLYEVLCFNGRRI